MLRIALLVYSCHKLREDMLLRLRRAVSLYRRCDSLTLKQLVHAQPVILYASAAPLLHVQTFTCLKIVGKP